MNYKEKLHIIKNFVFDIDGVFTNGLIMIDSSGNESRTFNTKDGIAIISGAHNDGIRLRLKNLGVTNILLGSNNKLKDLKKYIKSNKLSSEETVYMGDDIPDINPMSYVGLKTCPFDAIPEVRSISDYVSPKKGGEGCVRDIIEQTLKVQNNWKLKDSSQNI
ncbi:MAG: HAD hydrolase family protein [Flavobacteriaceae bacterium]|nr:HAD hydrolase family protein [Flavobacteriaceae bacterium]